MKLSDIITEPRDQYIVRWAKEKSKAGSIKITNKETKKIEMNWKENESCKDT